MTSASQVLRQLHQPWCTGAPEGSPDCPCRAYTATDVRHILRILGPRVVGGRYYNGYWRSSYTVTAIDMVGNTPYLTVQWADGHSTRHCTHWDRHYDQVLEQLLENRP